MYLELFKKYGDAVKYWPQWCAKRKNEDLREVVAIGAILTQRTSWTNAHLALRNLKNEKLLSLKGIANLNNLDKLTKLIKPAGFYQTKPKRLYVFAKFVLEKYGYLENFEKENTKVARQRLLNLYGIGPETADTILLYVLDKPSFVIDEYTKRFVRKYKLLRDFPVSLTQGSSLRTPRLVGKLDSVNCKAIYGFKLADTGNYEELKKIFEKALAKDVKVYQNYHVLIIVDGKGKEKSVMEVV